MKLFYFDYSIKNVWSKNALKDTKDQVTELSDTRESEGFKQVKTRTLGGTEPLEKVTS
jgi:hypothetical protein